MTPGPVRTEVRKVVTVLFADINGSTGLGQALDPESLRRVLARYFAEMKLVVERHEGLVSKFIGDAVMAVFGVPRLHEDDALRAVRAAAEMRQALAVLNDEFASSWGVTLAVRTGVNTGEVLTGEPGTDQSLVVGDAVNTAARLEQVAEPGEILIGEDTYRLVHAAVTAEPVGPLELRGKSTAVHAWRLLEVEANAAGWSRRLDSPLVGREHELARLEDAFQRAVDGQTCELVTVMAPAGVGKSRLTGELLSRLGSRATVLQGRCLPYGDGITFWPILSVLIDAVGMEDRDSPTQTRRKVSQILGTREESVETENELICDGLGPLLGFRTATVGIQETYWAVRKLLERHAGRRPLIVVFDDVHWGEATFLDLVEYLVDWIRTMPVLILCQARPELLDVRPGWMATKQNASLVALPALTGAQTDGLIRGLVGGTDLPLEARTRISMVAEGNPLFVEETLRMLVDHGVLRSLKGRWTVTGDLSSITIPPTIHALLTARLDRLEPEQRIVTERASVIGRSFWWGAVSELAPAGLRPRVGACLQSLVRKELIRPDRSEIRGEDAFRFTHILVRDAAYQGIPKTTRAEMHERLADWITAHMRDLAGGYEEIVGYHLEQAHRSLLELGPPNAETAVLAQRAAEALASAGERAYARGDMPAVVTLLTRAIALLPIHHARRLELLTEVAFALLETGDFERLSTAAQELHDAAAETGDVGLHAHAVVLGLWVRLFTDPRGWADEAEREARNAIAVYRELQDEGGLARAWSLLGLVHLTKASFALAEEAWSRAAEHANRAGNHRDALESLSWVPLTAWAGPNPTTDAIRRCREVLDEAQGDRKAMSSALFSHAVLEAGLGRFDEARELFGRARALLEEVALPVWMAGPLAQGVAWAELFEGHPASAELELRRAFETLSAIGEMSWLSTVAGMLAETIYAQGRYAETERFTAISAKTAGAEDVYSHVLWRNVQAKVLARQERTTEALELIDEASTLLENTDFLHLRWHELMSRAEILGLAGRSADATAAAQGAIRVAEQKGNLVGARLARKVLKDLLDPPAASPT
jgi:class 3 adenylate cyclase/tetratricopeptide (TPR) repeat protein